MGIFLKSHTYDYSLMVIGHSMYVLSYEIPVVFYLAGPLVCSVSNSGHWTLLFICVRTSWHFVSTKALDSLLRASRVQLSRYQRFLLWRNYFMERFCIYFTMDGWTNFFALIFRNNWTNIIYAAYGTCLNLKFSHPIFTHAR